MSLNESARMIVEAFAASLIESTTATMTRDNIAKSLHDANVARRIARGYYPPEGVEAREIDVMQFGRSMHINVWITPAPVKTRFKSSEHRVMCECPACGKALSAGRLAQHYHTVACWTHAHAAPAALATPRRRATDPRGNPGYNVPA